MRGVNFGVLRNDVRGFAAQLERDFLQVAGGGMHDQLADFGGTRERNLVNMRMRGERGAGGFAVAGNDVDDAVRNARFLNQFAQAEERRAASARRA